MKHSFDHKFFKDCMLKIALLFLVVSDIYHQEYWKDFLSGHENQYSVYIHAKDEIPADSAFKQFDIGVKVETTWTNTLKAQIELLRHALKDSANEKFIFLSESTIPFQSFNTVYATVMATDKSIFPFCLNPHQDPTRSGTFWGYHNYQPSKILHPIPGHLQYKHPQWIILNRKHAQMAVDDPIFADIVARYPCDNEAYFGTLLALHGLLHEVVNRQTTYDDWFLTTSGSSPFTFTDLHNENQFFSVSKAIQGKLHGQREPYLFGRKFAKECNLSLLDTYLPYRINALGNHL